MLVWALLWLNRVTPVALDVCGSLGDRCGNLPLSGDESSIKLGEHSDSPRGCFGNESHRVLYWRTDWRASRTGGSLVETISVAESGREGNFRVTFRDGQMVQWNESGLPGRPPSDTTTGALLGILICVRRAAGFR
ncbi:MAG: hypothetical protein AAB473_04115 [Patescibacteria group bacterium]